MSYIQHLPCSRYEYHDTLSGTKRKRPCQEAAVEEELAWTAARCNRLLRSITSRLNTLRRLHKSESNSQSNNGASQHKAKRRSSQHWSTVDPAWLPNSKKTSRQTYASKPVAARHKRKDTSTNHFPTAFVKRFGDRESTNPRATKHELLCDIQPRQTRQLPLKPTSTAQEAENGLGFALDNLLRQTKPPPMYSTSGPRSLFSTCLRKVPAYIAMLETGVARDDEEEDHHQDPTSEVYAYLDNMGTADNGGWHGLREVVRSHSLQLVADAVYSGFTSDNGTDAMIKLCVMHEAIPECFEILTASSHRSPSASTIYRFSMLPYVEEYDPGKFRLLRALVDEDAQFCLRLCDERDFLNDVLGELTGPAAHEASELFCSYVHCMQRLATADRLKSGAASQMRWALLKLTVMAAAAVLLSERGYDNNNSLVEIIHRLAVNNIIPETKQAKSARCTRAKLLAMVCAEILVTLDRTCNQELDHATLGAAISENVMVMSKRALPSTGRKYREDIAADFASSIIGLADFTGSNVLDKMLNRIAEVLVADSHALLLRQIALEVVTQLRESDRPLPEAILQDHLQQIFRGSHVNRTLMTPGQVKSSGRFRWEHGMNEWIAATPLNNCSIGHFHAPPLPGMTSSASSATGSSQSIATPQDSLGSPDVLAMSAPRQKRVRSEVDSFVAAQEVKIAWVVLPRPKSLRRRSGRISAKEIDGLEDELG